MMKALAVYPGKAQSLHLREIEPPRITSEEEVLVSSLQAGVCGTDQEINQGLYGTAPPREDYLILGHESLGIIAEVGKNTNLSVGDYVVRTVRRPCNNCANCYNGSNDQCSTGNYRESGIKELHGVMTQYFIEDQEYLVVVPSELKDIAVLLEPLSIVEKGTRIAYSIQRRFHWEIQNALVLGA